MLHCDLEQLCFVGPGGTLPLHPGDEIARKLAMLLEGDCGGLGPTAAARKFDLSRQRYFQLRHAYHTLGTSGLQSRKRGPRKPHRRTDEAVRQVIRHRFLDPDASAHVIAQKIRQAGLPISTRTVERIIAHYGLQKKTLPLPPQP
jgi:hypothetical protein